MGNILISAILIVGISGLVAQVLLLRELLVSFYGNELVLGVVLANWIISEALGVFVLGKFIDRIRNKINIFILFQILFSLTLPIAIYLSRAFKGILGIPFGQALGLDTIFLASFFIVLPVGFSHGALFSSLCKIYSTFRKEAAASIGKVYTWETIGTIFGGIIFTYAFIPFLNSLQIVFIVLTANFLICLFFLRGIARFFKITVPLLLALVILFSFSGGINYIHRLSIDKQWQAQEVLDYQNSVYGNVVVTKSDLEHTFFYNGIPVITAPYPDITFVQEFGHLPLLFHSNPKNILVVSAGAGGLINELLKHPIIKLDYAELDPLIIEMVKKYHSALTRREFADKRVNVINTDGRFFVRTTPDRYDVVLIGLSDQSDLSTNRLFTKEFFRLAKDRLKPGAIFAFWLPGSLTYLNQELKDLNVCIINTLKETFDSIRIIPGDYNIFLASDSKGILEVDANLITQRIRQRHIKTDLLIPAYIEYRLSNRWVNWFRSSTADATEKINEDLTPFAVFQVLNLWNRQFSPLVVRPFEVLKNLSLRHLFFIISLITLLLFYVFSRKAKSANSRVVYSIITTGFFGMLANLILIFGFQVFYGYLYHKLGLLISIFMAGIALGSLLMTYRLVKVKNNLRLFLKLEACIIIFSFVLIYFITRLNEYTIYAPLIFTILFFISGALVGLEFPLASKIYLGERGRVGNTAGVLSASDLIGGWVAGVFGGVILLPILGLVNTCIVIALFKLSSFLLLLFSPRDTSASA